MVETDYGVFKWLREESCAFATPKGVSANNRTAGSSLYSVISLQISDLLAQIKIVAVQQSTA